MYNFGLWSRRSRVRAPSVTLLFAGERGQSPSCVQTVAAVGICERVIYANCHVRDGVKVMRPGCSVLTPATRPDTRGDDQAAVAAAGRPRLLHIVAVGSAPVRAEECCPA